MHVSAPLQTLPSPHEVPVGTGALRQNAAAVPTPTQVSVVHAFLSLHGGGTEGACALNTPSPPRKLLVPMLMLRAHAAPVSARLLPVVNLPVTSR